MMDRLSVLDVSFGGKNPQGVSECTANERLQSYTVFLIFRHPPKDFPQHFFSFDKVSNYAYNNSQGILIFKLKLQLMAQQVESLKQSEVTQVLADAFALLYHQKPKFPVTFLANYLKNHEHAKRSKQSMQSKLKSNEVILEELSQKQKQQQQQQQKRKVKQSAFLNQQQEFLNALKQAEYHEDILDYFCDWIENRFDLTGVYIGQLNNQFQKINLLEDDSEESHLLPEAPKLISFNYASKSHKNIMANKTLPQDSVLGKLLSGEKAEGEGGQGEEKEESKPKDEIYIPNVVNAKEIHYFKFPKLGAFFGLGFKIKSYLHQKLFDPNHKKIQVYDKAKHDYDQEQEEEQLKFKELYDEKSGSGAEQAELEEMEREFNEKQALKEKPKLEDFEFVERSFVIGFDTLGKDKQISSEEQKKLRSYVENLKNEWESHEIQYLKADIKRNMGLVDKLEGPAQETFAKMIEEEDRELPSHEEVEKNKENEQWMELEMDTQRIQKLKEYFSDERFIPYFEQVLDAKLLKYNQILKYWLLFVGKSKQAINVPGTNILDFRKAKSFLDKQVFNDTINTYTPRGSKDDIIVKPYTKWERLLKCLQKFDQNTVSSYNIALAFILRFLQITGKVRLADRTKRLELMTTERRNRAKNIQENEQKKKERQEKLVALREEAETKQEPFDEQAWENQQNEENPYKEIGPEIPDEIDNDLEMVYVPPPEQNPAE